MQLTVKQKLHLAEFGYVKLEGVVPQVMVEEARRSINRALDPGHASPKEELQRLQRSEEIVGLYHKTPAAELAGSVVDASKLQPITSAQIALRMPLSQDRIRRLQPHLDGMYFPGNGVKEGTIGNFTLLMGILLSDLPETDAGNFTVWPGTHLQCADYFRKHGAESLLEGMPKIDWPEPVQITGKEGDVILAHYLLGHSAGHNDSPNIRYAAFFRLIDRRIKEERWQDSMIDLWMHWPGMQQYVR
jgi:Phytanoyl-CoA dioxygenase (PhyH).